MGITISSHKHSIDMGYGGFLRLRVTISTLLNCQEFADIYDELMHGFIGKWREKGFKTEEEYRDDYDKRALEICERNKLDEEVVNFLYRSDCSCESASVKTCRHLWKVIKDYDDDIIYGYAGRPDRAMFKDFKQIVEECTKERRVMRFS